MSLCKAQEVGINAGSKTMKGVFITHLATPIHPPSHVFLPCRPMHKLLMRLVSAYFMADLSFKYEENKRDTRTLALLLLQGRGKIPTSLSGYNAFLFK